METSREQKWGSRKPFFWEANFQCRKSVDNEAESHVVRSSLIFPDFFMIWLQRGQLLLQNKPKLKITELEAASNQSPGAKHAQPCGILDTEPHFTARTVLVACSHIYIPVFWAGLILRFSLSYTSCCMWHMFISWDRSLKTQHDWLRLC